MSEARRALGRFVAADRVRDVVIDAHGEAVPGWLPSLTRTLLGLGGVIVRYTRGVVAVDGERRRVGRWQQPKRLLSFPLVWHVPT